MIIFLYGRDTYRSRQKLNEIIERYKKTLGKELNLKSFDGKTIDFKELEDENQQISMFGGRKLIVLQDVFQNQQFKEKFLLAVEKFNHSQDLILFYETAEISKNDKLFKLLKKQGKSQEFKPLTGNDLKSWTRREFEASGVTIEEAALEKIISFIGNNLWRFSNEIKKVASYKREGTVEEKDIDLLIKPRIETDIFKTIDAFAGQDKKGAILLIHKHLEKGDSPLYLLSMINYQFRNLLVIKDLIKKNKPLYLIPKETQLHPYVVKKSYIQAGKFTIAGLKKIYQKVFQADINIKTGKLDAQTALDLLIAGI